MTEEDVHMESERLIEEARLEIEAIKEALEAARGHPDTAKGTLPAEAKDWATARTN